MICQNLNRITNELFADIRMGVKSLTVEEIKEILRVEIRKQILRVQHVMKGIFYGHDPNLLMNET